MGSQPCSNMYSLFQTSHVIVDNRMPHEEVDRPEMSKTDYSFEAKNNSIFIEEIPLFVDYSNFMFSLFILVTKGTYFDSCSE